MVLNISRQVIVNAGVNETICETGTYELTTATSTYATGVAWTTSGTGTFSNFETLNPVYTPSAADITSGSVTLTLTGISASPCVNASDIMILTISGQPVADAGVDATICQGSTYTVSTATASNYTTLAWIENGTGSLTGSSTLTPMYTPGAGETGVVTLTLTASAASGCIPAVSTMTITINGLATASAGADATICETAGSYSLTGAATNYASYLWTTNGTGTFSNTTTTLSPTYTPSAADITAGSVILTLNVTGNAPCSATSDAMTLTIKRQAIVNAGADATICESAGTYSLSGSTASHTVAYLWATSGTGTFADATILHAVYTPSAADINAGSVILTVTATSTSPCTSATDAMTLTINRQAIVNAGTDATICATGTYTLTTATSSYTTSMAWSTTGTGTFSNVNVLNPVYTPSAADIAAGTVTLTLTGMSAQYCARVTDAMILTIHAQPVANAGTNATICQGTAFTVNTASASNYTTILWTATGAGTLTNAGTLTPTYTPTALQTGTVTLTLTASAASGCIPAVSTMTIIINGEAWASAGADATICETAGNYTLTGGATNYSAYLWTTNGSGTFSNTTMLSPIYTPSAADITAGSVILTLTVTGNAPCGNTSDAMLLTIHRQPAAYAGTNAVICQGSTYTVNTATASNYTSLAWTENGTGSLTNASTLTPTYTPGAGETGVVTLTLTAGASSACSAAISTMVITIKGAATANAGADATICETAGSHTLAGAATNYSSFLWTTNGTGTFSNATTTLSPVYTPSAADIAAGSVNLTLNVTGNAPCGSTSDAMVLTIRRQASVNAGSDATVCEGSVFTVSTATSANAGTISWTHNGNGTLTGANTLTPTYTPASGETGTVTLTVTASSTSPCVNVTDQMVITIVPAAIVSAGSDATICETSSYTLQGTAENYTSIFWTTSGTGTFSNPTSTLTPVYTPGAADITAGTVTLTLHVTGNTTCGSASDAMILTINSQAIVNAGADATICETSTSYVCNATASNYTSLYWETTGTGTFTNNQILNPVYIPSQADIDAGCVYLILHVTGTSCGEVTDAMKLCISRIPLANAGPDDMICKDESYLVSGSTALYYGNITWSTSGTGTFDDIHAIHPVYTPSTADISAGSVILTMYLTANSPCPNASDAMVLNFYPNPVAAAYLVANVRCDGFSDGVLSVNVTSGTPGFTYLWSDGQTTQTAVGLAAGTYTVTVTDSHGCKDYSSATVGINPLPILVITNPNPVCFPNTVNIADPAVTFGSTMYGSTLSYWLDEAATSPMSNYATAGAGTYYIKATTVPGCYDIKPVTVTVNPLPSATAGANRAICLKESTQLGAAPVSGNTYSWSSVPAGFTSTVANPTVTPAFTITYTVMEIITATGCTSSHSVVVTVNPLPSASAGTSRMVCITEGTTIGAPPVAGNTYVWSSVPAGFTSTLANPTVYPVITTTYSLVETNTTTGCSNSNSIQITVNPKPVLVITNPAPVCSPSKVNLTDAYITAGSNLEGGVLSYWLDAAGTTPMLNYTAATAGTYYIKATTPTGCADIDPVVVSVNPLPTLYNGTGSGSYCPGGPGLVLGISGSQIGVTYTLWTGLTAVSDPLPGTGGPIIFGSYTIIGYYWVLAENVTTHCINRMDNCVHITLEPQLPVSVSITASENPITAGTVVTFTASIVNGGSAPAYQWKVNGFNAGTSSPTFAYAPGNADVVTCVLTSNASCVSGNPATSNAITMDVMGVPVTVTVTGVVSNGETNCYNAIQTLTIAGNGTTFTVQNGGSATMIAGHNIRYLPGTTVQAGGYMYGYITTNSRYCGQAPALVTVVAGEDELVPPAMEQSCFKLYPNPTSGNFTIELKGDINYDNVNVEVYSMRGERLMTEKIVGERKHEFWLPDLPHGLYYVKVVADDHLETFKLVKTR
jgi:hypothetical protein